MYDYLIVGAGFFGATFARQATDLGKKCLVIDKKSHVAGAAYDTKAHDYYVSEYGAHIFHTNSVMIWDFVNQFSRFNSFVNRPKVVSQGKIYSFPINLMTLQQLYGVKTPKEAKNLIDKMRVNIKNPSNFEEWMLTTVGEDLYRRFYYHYTKRQWLREPKDLPMSIAQRVPIRLTYDENYFITHFQGIPQTGYTKLIRNMLDGIDVEIGENYSENLGNKAKRVIYTGPIDEFYEYSFGRLDYRSLKFEKMEFSDDQQGTAVLNYTDEEAPYLRSIEHRHFYHFGECVKHYNKKSYSSPSIITYDVPVKCGEVAEPYYPIRDKQNSEIYDRYSAIQNKRVIFGGRLGEYKYYDMDQSMASAMALVTKLEELRQPA